MSQPTELQPRPGLDLSISVVLASMITLVVLLVILIIRGDWVLVTGVSLGWGVAIVACDLGVRRLHRQWGAENGGRP